MGLCEKLNKLLMGPLGVSHAHILIDSGARGVTRGVEVEGHPPPKLAHSQAGVEGDPLPKIVDSPGARVEGQRAVGRPTLDPGRI